MSLYNGFEQDMEAIRERNYAATDLENNRLSEPPFSPNTCRAWSTVLQVATTLNVLGIDIVIMLRGISMILLFLVGIAVHVGKLFALYTKTEFNSVCNVTRLSRLTIYLTSALAAMKTIIWGMTAARTQFMPRNIPIVQLVINDGIWTIVLPWALYIANMPYAMATGFLKFDIAYTWAITFLSIARIL
ncbi:hypothetical protein BDQ17DRAFT_1326839 [Cyathus striatus]|nr:hypothetical protein BDQ17DRAFT_1326839 [Cyathus striatus]